MQTAHEIKYVTTNFRQLQGLRILPWLVWTLIISAINPVLGLPQGWLDYQMLFGVPGLVVAWWVSKQIGNYYDRQFGRIESLPKAIQPLQILATLAAIAIFYAAFAVDNALIAPISFMAMLMALFFAGSWWFTGRIRQHLLLMAVLFACSAPLIPWIAMAMPRLNVFALPIVVSLLSILTSILDHLFLVRALNPLAEE